jgi:hypothetical protein
MLCFRDKTFCEFKECIYSKECETFLSDKLQQEAEKWWWGENPPISVYVEKPSCYKDVDTESHE